MQQLSNQLTLTAIQLGNKLHEIDKCKDDIYKSSLLITQIPDITNALVDIIEKLVLCTEGLLREQLDNLKGALDE